MSLSYHSAHPAQAPAIAPANHSHSLTHRCESANLGFLFALALALAIAVTIPGARFVEAVFAFVFPRKLNHDLAVIAKPLLVFGSYVSREKSVEGVREKMPPANKKEERKKCIYIGREGQGQRESRRASDRNEGWVYLIGGGISVINCDWQRHTGGYILLAE